MSHFEWRYGFVKKMLRYAETEIRNAMSRNNSGNYDGLTVVRVRIPSFLSLCNIIVHQLKTQWFIEDQTHINRLIQFLDL